ncbi:MAG: hypothetical protein WBB01_14915 [Phormidesmis sp.]
MTPASQTIPTGKIRYNDQELVLVISQSHLDGTVLMLIWMNADALQK